MTVINRQRSRRVDRSKLVSFMRRVVEKLPADETGEVVICLVSDRKMREFNRRYRGRDTPTDVLAFPGENTGGVEEGRYLGDIAISVETAVRQARVMNHSLDRELEVLALHGYLHLLGYDHERDGGEMMRLQRRLERSLAASRGSSAMRR